MPDQKQQQKRHVDERAAADYLDVSVPTLKDWRFHKTGPVYGKFGKAVRYAVSDLEKYVEASRVRMAA